MTNQDARSSEEIEEHETYNRQEVSNPHTGEEHGETVSLCPTCKQAFDMGAGNV